MVRSIALMLIACAIFVPLERRVSGWTQNDFSVPSNAAFKLQLLSPISTTTNRKGDKFSCLVVAPNEFKDATVEGRITKLKSGGRAGKISEIGLAFSSITMPDGRVGRFDGQVMEVYDIIARQAGPGEEGEVDGKSVRKRTLNRSVAGAVIGGIVGGVLGGGQGAAIGAAVGAGVGATTSLSEKSPNIEFSEGTLLDVKTAGRSTTGTAADSPPRTEERAPRASPPRQYRKAHPARTQKPTTTVRRYPTMECPGEVGADQQFAVQVSLTRALVTPQVRVESGKNESNLLSLTFPDYSDQRPWKIDVVLSASEFSFWKGANTSTILLDRNSDSSLAVFYVQPNSTQAAKPQSRLCATFWHEGTFLARVFRDITIISQSGRTPTGKDQGARGSAVKSNPARGGKTIEAPIPPVEMSFDLKKPDLTVFLSDREMIIDSPYLQPASYRYDEAEDLSKWLDLQYSKIAKLTSRGLFVHKEETTARIVNKEQASLAMRGFGRELFQKFAPSAFKEAFWKLFDKLGPRFKTIQVLSDNPILPWELMRPVRNDGTGEREFLGVEFTIGRWHLSKGISQLDRPPQSILADKIIVVAPQYERNHDLPGQQREIRSLKVFGGFIRLPGQLGSMKTLFDDFPQAIIHFAGHGGVESTNQNISEYAIQLEDGILNLTTWKGMINTQNKNHPFFFLNACDVGQAKRMANFVNGWAPAALEAGASGYIGALWPIDDSGAAEFAAQFYDALFAAQKKGNTSVASVLTETRRSFLKNSDPTFLAYVYYGDPHLKLVTRDTK